MVVTRSRFQARRAPCGQTVGGERYRDQDEDAPLTDDQQYECGCRSVRHEYHDGSLSQTVVRHDGRVLIDELLAEW